MKCPECSTTEKEHNEMIGETCCVNCGLVLSWTPIEETTIVKTPDEHSFEKLHIDNLRGKTPHLTNQGLGSHIFPNDKVSSRLAFTQLRASSHYRGGLSDSDKHMIVLLRNPLHQYGHSLASGSNHIIKATMRLKNRLGEMNKLRGYPVETRASVLLYLIMQQVNLTNLTRHSNITGLDRKKLSKLSRKFARLMEIPQIFSVTNNRKMIGDTLDLMGTNGVDIHSEFRMECTILSDYISSELDKRDLPYKNSTNSTVIWMVSMMRDEGILQSEICAVNSVTAQTIRSCLRLILYPMFNFDRQCLKELTVEEFVSGIRTQEYEKRNEK